MTLKTIATGSSGNCYILTSDNDKHLILDAGIPIAEIKKGLNYDVENVVGAIVSHSHKDHSLSVNKLKKMGIPIWQPYLSDKVRMRTRLGEFEIECFNVPHNGTPNRAFLIKVDGSTILYCTDFEYCPYDLTSRNIDTMIIEMNYQADRISDMDEHRQHVVLGHAEEKTTIEILKQNIKSIKNVILIHMSNSGSLDRGLAMKHVREVIPEYIVVEWAIPGKTYNISLIPF